MRALLQRVSSARVRAGDEETGSISSGLLIFLGVGQEDSEIDISKLVEKILRLRIFPDGAGKLSQSLLDISGELLIVSQFTLYADCRHGRRPDFTAAASSESAEILYNKFVQHMKGSGLKIATGRFGAMMTVELINDGPVTVMLESKEF